MTAAILDRIATLQRERRELACRVEFAHATRVPHLLHRLRVISAEIDRLSQPTATQVYLEEY